MKVDRKEGFYGTLTASGVLQLFLGFAGLGVVAFATGILSSGTSLSPSFAGGGFGGFGDNLFRGGASGVFFGIATLLVRDDAISKSLDNTAD